MDLGNLVWGVDCSSLHLVCWWGMVLPSHSFGQMEVDLGDLVWGADCCSLHLVCWWGMVLPSHSFGQMEKGPRGFGLGRRLHFSSSCLLVQDGIAPLPFFWTDGGEPWDIIFVSCVPSSSSCLLAQRGL